MKDVDDDDDLDMVFRCRIQDLDLDENSTQATLEGETTGGDPITSTDTVEIVPPNPKKNV